jgi:hypothetical protein
MPGLYEIEFFPESRKEQMAGSRGNYYEFEDGSHLDLRSQPVWCCTCGNFSHGERIETLAELDRQIADLDDPTSMISQLNAASRLNELGEGENFRRAQIKDFTERRHWREKRSSPPKCICCGSTAIIIFEMGKSYPNPSGSGEVVVNLVGMCSTEFNEWFFTPEGDRIPRDTTPTYWHFPGTERP